MTEYRATAVAMPGNTASEKVGGQTGLFRVLIESRERGGDWQFIEYRGENMPYKEAFILAGTLQRELNANSGA